MKTQNVLIDTSIVLDGVENVTMIDKDSNVFVTDVVLRELDGNKGAEGSKGYNAREFFRQLNNHSFVTLNAMPSTGNAVLKNDTLTEGSIDSGAHVYTLSRKWYRSKDINDTKIIEMAKDYNLTLNTFDQAQCARAKSEGIMASVWKKLQISDVSKTTSFLYKTGIFVINIFALSMIALQVIGAFNGKGFSVDLMVVVAFLYVFLMIAVKQIASDSRWATNHKQSTKNPATFDIVRYETLGF